MHNNKIEKGLKESTSKLDRTEEALYLSIEKKLKEQKELERKIKVLEEKDENKEIERNPQKEIRELKKKLKKQIKNMILIWKRKQELSFVQVNYIHPRDLAQSTFYALHRPLLTIGSEMLNNQSLEKQQQKIYEEEEEEESQQIANKFLNDIESRIRKQQFSDDFENIVENNIKQGSPLAKIGSSSFKKQIINGTLHCDSCDIKTPRIWICLNSNCRVIVCKRNSPTGHLHAHVEGYHKGEKKNHCHCIFVNPRNLAIWCQACNVELNPFEKNFLSLEMQKFLKTIVRCLQVKKHKSHQSFNNLTIDVPGLVGLKNLGNTCYARPSLTNYFSYCESYIPKFHTNTRLHEYKLAERFHRFFRSMWNGNSTLYSPSDLIDEIKNYNEAFRGYGQQDSQEFLRCVLDILHEELPYPQNTISNDQINENTNNNSNHIAKSSSYARRLLESKIKCLKCKKDYFKEDRFYDLSIQINKKYKSRNIDSALSMGLFVGTLKNALGIGGHNASLHDCLAEFCATENLAGKDKYQCEQCKSLNDCQKTLRITQLPEILCIQLKRFHFDPYVSSKIATHVQFPMENLDMRPYCKESVSKENCDSPGISEKRESLKVTKYDLYALIHHRGGLAGGHYIAYAKNPIDGNWYEFDDMFVTKKSADEIMKIEAYILFYSKKNPEKDQERVLIQNLIRNNSEISENGTHCWVSRLWFNRWQFMMTVSINVKLYPKLHDMVVKIPINVYSMLVDKYGTDGSPPLLISDVESAGCSICQQQERLMDKRRQKEARDIQQLDTNSLQKREYWFLISSVWLQKWHNFKAGAPPPGHIDNTTFLKKDGTPRPGMKIGIDYRGVNERVWSYFEYIYGGGPVCVRAVIDLYSSPLDFGNSQTKSNYNNVATSPKNSKYLSHQSHHSSNKVYQSHQPSNQPHQSSYSSRLIHSPNSSHLTHSSPKPPLNSAYPGNRYKYDNRPRF
ncbi:670_t:CDS:10 [Entrophospora sp. SA101]|nr:670_t:CDS:10 [Entrophospora sp. SA101]